MRSGEVWFLGDAVARFGALRQGRVRSGRVWHGMSWFLGEAIEVVCGKVWSGSVR